MSTIDRNILRIGVYEMMYSANPTPVTVAINEALEISKIYGTQDSPSFINGILDQVQKETAVAALS